MAYLNVGGVDVNVAYMVPVERVAEPLGELKRSFTGKLLSSVRGFRDTYGPITTVRMTETNGNTLWAALAAGSVAVYGDLFGTTSGSPQNMHVVDKSWRHEQIGSSEYVVITFTLADED